MRILGLAISIFISSQVIAQDYVPISNGTVSICSGLFTDDGLEDSYAPGQSYAFTLCPENPGEAISVDFAVFSLYHNINPINNDFLSIFDGENADAILLGNFTSTSLVGASVTATVSNASGCLTFVFNSSPFGPGDFAGWEANISCTTPCALPTAIGEIVDPETGGSIQSIQTCPGEEVIFSDNGSYAEDGLTLSSWIWNFGDGAIQEIDSDAEVSHSFSAPGEYLVYLSVEDNNGCRSLNAQPLQILISTVPVFNSDFDSVVCLNHISTIDASPVQSVIWSTVPPLMNNDTTYFSDGFAYSTSLTFDFFEQGAILQSCDDLQSVFVNMEHSYLGDLEISITCPDGTTAILLDYPNGGGGTFLGQPIDNGSLDSGVGYDYAWNPYNTNGNLSTQVTEPSGGPTPGNTVPSGSYESDFDMCALVGCPLNGDWTMNIVDNLGADDGYVFSWGIDFNPALIPDVTTIEPVLGTNADSSWWEGPNIVNTSADGNTIETEYDTPGFYDYTYFVTNDFGCTFDTTITIEATGGPEITAGPDFLLACNEPVQFQAGLVNTPNPSCANDGGNYTYCYDNNENLVVTYCPDSPFDGFTMMTLEFLAGDIEQFGDGLNIYNGENEFAPWLAAPFVTDLTGLSYVASNPSGCLTFVLNSNAVLSCANGGLSPIEIVVGCQPAEGIIWSWEPTTGLINPNVQNPIAIIDGEMTYTVTAFPIDLPGCVVSDELVVSPAFFESEIDTVYGPLLYCIGDLVTYSLPNISGATSFEWTLPPDWSESSDTQTISSIGGTSGVIGVRAYDGCSFSAPFEFEVNSITIPDSTSFIQPETDICLDVNVSYTYTIEDVADAYYWTISGSDITNAFIAENSITFNWIEEGYHSISVLPANECGEGYPLTIDVDVFYCLSLNDSESLDGGYSIWPNPADNFVQVKRLSDGGGILTIGLYNVLGQEITDISMTDSGIDISEVARGVYIVHIYEDEELRQIERLVIN